jgi:hypothetical protein
LPRPGLEDRLAARSSAPHRFRAELQREETFLGPPMSDGRLRERRFARHSPPSSSANANANANANAAFTPPARE